MTEHQQLRLARGGVRSATRDQTKDGDERPVAEGEEHPRSLAGAAHKARRSARPRYWHPSRALTRRQMLVARIGETAYVYGETFC